MLKVFICHSSLDKQFARTIADDLRNRGADVWIDETNMTVGDSLFGSIAAGLEQSDYVLVLITADSMARPWVQKELSAAFSLEVDRGGKVILPVLLEDAVLPVLLRDKLYADFRSSYTEGFQSLERALGLAYSDPVYSFRTLESVVRITIHDAEGCHASYERKGICLCLHDNVDFVTDRYYVDGEIENIRVSPGNKGKIWTQLGQTFVQTRFPENLKKGSILHHIIEMDLNNCFCEKSEYWDAKMEGYIEKTSVEIVFPIDRSPTNWWVEEHAGSGFHESQAVLSCEVIAEHTVLRMEITKPPLARSYLLHWDW